jgi:ABC-type transport system involved in cytochrome c biogenesis permease subunit
VQIVFLFLRKSDSDIVSRYLLLAASGLLFATIVVRSILISFVAVTNMFESLTLLSAVLLLILFLYGQFSRSPIPPLVQLGATLVALCFLAIASSPVIPKDVLPPVPALRSAWLVLHVVFAFIGEAFFAVSCAAACVYFLARDADAKERADRVVYTSIGIGYPIYAIGALIFGAIWAQVAWGSFWSWDAKEIWALVTCLVYTIYLHVRLVMKKKGPVSSLVAIIGFLVTLFTLFGVNYLLYGLHSYT